MPRCVRSPPLLWTVILIGSVIGLFHPVSMSPVLLIQVIYNSLWLGVFVVPLLVRGRGGEVNWGIAGTFLFIVLTDPWVIPWTKMSDDSESPICTGELRRQASISG